MDSRYYERNTYWPGLLTEWDRALIYELGGDPDYPSTAENLILTAMADGSLVEAANKRRTNPEKTEKNGMQKIMDLQFNRNSLVRLATILQMVVYDAQNGPDGEGFPEAIRNHWYDWYKVNLAQPLSQQIFREDVQADRWPLNWFGRLSETYKKLVDTGEVTYLDLWVEDSSRKIEQIFETLFGGLNLVLAVEKSSLHRNFVRAARALGAKVVIAGNGKPSAAATELMIREHFGWPGRESWDDDLQEYVYTEPFSADNPLIFITVTDWDKDGEVIEDTFATQARRYTQHILEARVGIKPPQIIEKGLSMRKSIFQVKIKKDKGYEEWIQNRAIFIARCPVDGERHYTMGTGNQCPDHGVDFDHLDYWGNDIPYGFEVEAMQTSHYRSYLVDALLSVLPYEFILRRLREDAHADPYQAVENIRSTVLEDNATYQALRQEIWRLQDMKDNFDNDLNDLLQETAEEHQHDFVDEGDDPPVEDFVRHVEGDSQSPWRPFKAWERTQLLSEYLTGEFRPEIDEFAEGEVSLIARVKGTVSDSPNGQDFGYIEDSDGATLIFHTFEVQDGSHGLIFGGAPVIFTPVEGRNGPTAVNIELDPDWM